MPIQFYEEPHKPQKRIGFLHYTVPQFVRFMGGPDLCVKLHMHWRGERGVPCRGEECVDCPHDTFVYGYAPVVVGAWTNERFYPSHPVILPITSESIELAIDDAQNAIFKVWRRNALKNGPTCYYKVKTVDPWQVQPFDLLVRLEAMWRALDARDLARAPRMETSQGKRKLRPFGSEQLA